MSRDVTFQMSCTNFTDLAKDVKRRGGDAMPAVYRSTDSVKGGVFTGPVERSAALMSGKRGRRAGGTELE
jgi:hypothetical protein